MIADIHSLPVCLTFRHPQDDEVYNLHAPPLLPVKATVLWDVAPDISMTPRSLTGTDMGLRYSRKSKLSLARQPHLLLSEMPASSPMGATLLTSGRMLPT